MLLDILFDFIQGAVPGRVTLSDDGGVKNRGPGNLYDIGSQAVLSATFKNLFSALVDPGTVMLRVRDPAGNVTSYTYAGAQLVRTSSGVYTFNLPLPLAGTYFYRFEGGGSLIATGDAFLQVVKSKVLGY